MPTYDARLGSMTFGGVELHRPSPALARTAGITVSSEGTVVVVEGDGARRLSAEVVALDERAARDAACALRAELRKRQSPAEVSSALAAALEKRIRRIAKRTGRDADEVAAELLARDGVVEAVRL